jgi:hypothetical protein
MPMAKAVVLGSLLSVGLAGALVALAAQAAGGSYVVPGSQAATLDSCVEQTDFMRRNHMEVIKHQRDETVHNGIRSTKHSLAGCVECHASGDPAGGVVPVDRKGQFCQACHAFAAVGMNCFDCHATVPSQGEQGQGSPSRSPLAASPRGAGVAFTGQRSGEGYPQ